MVIRQANSEDIEQIMALVHELAVYEKAPEEVTNTAEQMKRDGFGEIPLFKSIVAEIENEIVGFALYYYRYSTWKGKVLYLEDFYVKENRRNFGIGKQLFEAVIATAKNDSCVRISWQVLEWNSPAISFYNQFNAGYDKTWWNGFIDIK